MCAACKCGKKKGEPGFGKGPKKTSKKAASKEMSPKQKKLDTDKDGNSISGANYKTVQYEKIVPLLIEAIKELTVKVNTLESQINKQ